MTDKVDIYVDKEITAIGLPPVAKTYVREKLTFRNPEYEEILKRAKEEEKAERLAVTPEYLYFFEEDTSDNILAIPLGFYEDLLNLLNTLQITYIIHPLYEEKRVTFPPHSISLRPYQVVPVKNSVVEFKNNPSFMFLSKAGSGKAQPVDSLVLTPSGYVPIGMIRKNDLVICPRTGLPIQVLGVYPQGIKEVYTITFSDGSKAESCLEHLWSVRENNERFLNKPFYPKSLREIKNNYLVRKGKRSKYSIPIASPLEFKEINTPLDPYILGAILGDGSISHGNCRLSSKDEEILNSFDNFCKENNLHLVRIKNSNCDYRITTKQHSSISKNFLIQELKKLKLWGCTSHTKFIPNIYLFNSIENRISLLQGLLDTDGTVHSGMAIFNTTSLNLMEGIKFIVQSLGGTCRITSKVPTFTSPKGNKKQGKLSFNIIINLPNFQLFRLNRKLISVRKEVKYFPSRFIRSIDFSRKEECVCIKVDSIYEEYMTNECIVTHNTTCALWIAHAMGQKTLWLTDLGILYDQVIERIITFLNIPREDIGEIKPGVIKIGKHITVGMIPTIYNFDDITIQKIEKEFGLIIVDEVVSIPTKRFFGVISRLSSPYKLGLTALAHREDGLTEAIYRIIGNPKIQPKPGGIVYPKIIRRPTGCKYYVRPDLLTKYKFILDRKIISDKKRNKLIVDDIAMYHDKFITIVLTRSVEHMEELRNSLKAVHNVDSCMIHSKQNDKLNAVQKQAFESNEKNIMFATYNMLKKGYDYPRVDRLIFAFPVSSREWIVQTVGRATREAPGKKGAIVLDYVDEAEMLTAQANIREKVYKEEGLHVVTKTEKEYLDDSDKSRLFDENDNKR